MNIARPIRIGFLDDMSDGPECPSDIADWVRREVDGLIEAGRIDRPVEFVQAHGLGLPTGSAAAVERALRRLDDEDVLLVVGPAIGDNALAVTPLVERLAIPTINWAGAERARGEWMFHLQVGSHEDESLVLARHFAGLGVRRLAVVSDASEIGRRHLAYLVDEAERLGLPIVASTTIAPTAGDATAQVGQVLGAGPDAICYLGLGLSAAPVAKALSEQGFTGERAMNTAGLRGYHGTFAAAADGWAYVDMVSDDNATLNAFAERAGVAPERRLAAAKGHDLGRLVAEGIARAPALTRPGLREGLEQVKWLPAAQGEEGTLLGFGIQDRGALHGRYLVMRRWRSGRSVQE